MVEVLEVEIMPKYRLLKDGETVGYMELQPICCARGPWLLWRYSENGKTGWDGQSRKRPRFNEVELVAPPTR
jgi:hypothetical protein